MFIIYKKPRPIQPPPISAIDFEVPFFLHDPSQLVSKPNTTSKVWRYFELAVEEKGKPKSSDLPVCRICFSEVFAKRRNTSNLYTHLQKKHPEKHLDVKPTTSSSTAGSTTGHSSKQGQQQWNSVWLTHN